MIYKTITKHCVNAFNRAHIEVRSETSEEDGVAYRIMTRLKNMAIDQVVDLVFQHEDDANGITNEALIAVVIDRLERFQEGPYKCRENALTITKLEEALLWQGARAARIEMEDRDEGIKAP